MKKILSVMKTHSPYDTQLIILYLLNVSDYLFTLTLLSSGAFIEANPILSSGINDVSGFTAKCIIPLILLTYIHFRFCTSPVKHPKAVGILLALILTYYILINLMHIFWLAFSAFIFI